VHISSDYVFDGVAEEHTETEAFAPMGVYGQSKAAGDIAVANVARHYILRSSWVIGEGHNFVKTMMMLAKKVTENDSSITVVNDQHGRLTFTKDMAEAIFHLLDSQSAYGTYNLTGSGRIASWCDIAQEVFALVGADTSRVKPVDTDEYMSNASGPVAPRPVHSALDLHKLASVGYVPQDWEQSLVAYVEKEQGDSAK
jgi:dTDP-4-dehydrorhamnose 3,5-epimerase